MHEIKLLGQIVLDLVQQPLVVKVRKHVTNGGDEELHGGDVGCRGLSKPRVLHLDGQLAPVVASSLMNLKQGCSDPSNT